MKRVLIDSLGVRVVLATAVILFCYDAIAAEPAARTLVRKVAEDFRQTAWQVDAWSSAKGETSLVQGNSAGALAIDVHFSGKGFEHYTAGPPQPLWIPGDAKSVTLRSKAGDSRYSIALSFVDGWGREKAGDANLSCPLRIDPAGNWQTTTFKVPDSWVRPIGIKGITLHNWDARNAKNTVHVEVGELLVETDIARADPATGQFAGWQRQPDNPKALSECPRTPLVSVGISSGEESNVFTVTPPQVCIRLQNWKPGVLKGTLACRVVDSQGRPIEQFEHAVTVDSSAAVTAPLKIEQFGLYTLTAQVKLADGTDRTEQMVLARLPAGKPLIEKQKLASPYGLNVHSGANIVLVPFRKAGIIWFREYCFQYDWVLRAKGDDNKYAGWPYYPKIVAAYREADAKCLPVLQHSIRPPAADAAGRIGPDRPWSRELSGVINAFPEISHWELSNEYDLPADNSRAEERIDWANYRRYHRQFANIIDVLGSGELTAVENGRAGIWPKRVERCVKSGDFAHIGVVNSHHYCGTDAPETNFVNFNMGTESKLPGLFFDELRAVKRAAQADGTPRQSWLTEFGWDTLAGPVVSNYQQAVYLPRAWMTAMAAGTDKAFWFYNLDAAEPKQFFDGCGLLTAKAEPKLSLCAMAGLSSVLPAPTYLGDLDAGPNTCGYVFRNDDQLVAALWSIADDNGPTVTLAAAELRDYLGNPVAAGPVRLTMAPVYAVGLSKSSPWYQQTAYSLETPHLLAATAGDPVRLVVRVDNNRETPLAAQLRLMLPPGWKSATSELPVSAAPGEVKNVAFEITIPFAEELGIKEVQIVVAEEKEIKQLTTQVLVQPPLTVQVAPMEGRPGQTEVTVTVGNRSAKTMSGEMTLRLPASWQAITPTVAINDLKPQETRPVACRFAWSAQWQPQETASVELDFGPGRRTSKSLIPNQYAIHRAGRITIDGQLNDWPAETRLPVWMVGSTAGEARAALHLAWADEGLYAAVEVHDSKRLVKDPRSFWAGDVLEMFLDSADNKRPRKAAPGDHQFWLVPQPAENRVYLGQWKMGDETPATRYDIPGIRGAARTTADGYVMEFLLPAAAIRDYHPQAGARLGLNLNLTIPGRTASREAYWPGPKNAGVNVHPDRWGTVLLIE